MAEIGWSGVLIAAIFIADVVVFLGLILEDRRQRRPARSAVSAAGSTSGSEHTGPSQT